MAGYGDGGSVTGKYSTGSSFFSLNMTPPNTYPRNQADAIQRRMMVRLQMLSTAWHDAVP